MDSSTEDERKGIGNRSRVTVRLKPFWRRFIDGECERTDRSQTEVIMEGLRMLRASHHDGEGTPLPPEPNERLKAGRKKRVKVEEIQAAATETNENQA